MEIARCGLFILCVCLFVRPCAGNAWMMDPPSRSAAWNYGIRAPINYDFRTLNCGDVKVEIQADGSRNCGMCGDPVSDTVPRPNENGGTYAPNVILTRYFESGQTAEISIFNNYPDQPGFYEFRLCENGDNPTQACLDANLLIVEDNSTRMSVPGQGLNMVHVRLPAGVTCSHCLLQWRFKKGNSAWGCDKASGWCGLGYGPQKEYYNCADIMIGAVGMPKPSDRINDPTYTDADYGSAYDSATTHGPHNTTPRIGPSPTNAPPTVPTVPVTTPSPVTTSARIITIPPFTTNSVTSARPAVTTPPIDDRLVVINADGAGGSMIVFDDTNNNNNNAGLLLLLGLLPILGALSQNNVAVGGPGPVPFIGPAPAVQGPIPPAVGPLPPANPSGLWTGQSFLSDFALGNSIGYGNFGALNGGSHTNKGNYYGKKKSYYGNSVTSMNYGNNMAMSPVQTGNIQGTYPVGNFVTTGNILHRPAINSLGSQSPWENGLFVQKSESFVSNGISRQAINNPGFSNKNGIQGQHHQYAKTQPHQYPSNWQNQQTEYPTNQIHDYQKNQATNLQKQTTGWNTVNPNSWNSRSNGNSWNSGNNANSWNSGNNANSWNSGSNGNSWNSGNNANIWNSRSKPGWSNTNNINNNNGWKNINSNDWNRVNSNAATSLNEGWTSPNNNQLNNNIAGSTGNWNTARSQLGPGTSHLQKNNLGNQQVSRNQFSPSAHTNTPSWNQETSQSVVQVSRTHRQPQVHDLYYQLLGDHSNSQIFNQQSGGRLGSLALPETRSL